MTPIHLCHAYHCSFCRESGRPTIDKPSVKPQTMRTAVNQCSKIAVVLYRCDAPFAIMQIPLAPLTVPFSVAQRALSSCEGSSHCTWNTRDDGYNRTMQA